MGHGLPTPPGLSLGLPPLSLFLSLSLFSELHSLQHLSGTFYEHTFALARFVWDGLRGDVIAIRQRCPK